METKTRVQKTNLVVSVLLTGKERLTLLRGIRGMWRNRKPDPMKELKKIREGWARKLPLFQ